MPRQSITSFQNSKLKLASKLVNKRQREQTGLFIVDAARDLKRALDQNFEVELAFYCAHLATDEDRALVATLDESTVFDVTTPELMTKASYRQNPGGLVALLRQKPLLDLEAATQLGARTILALVNLRKPGNIGALLRTADASGFDMICLIDTSLDVYNPNIIRSSTGAVFLPNIAQMTTEEALTFFNEQNVHIVAAHLQATRSLYELDLTQRRIAIVLGTEDTGLDATWVNHSDTLIKIPMMGRLSDSLNVSVSGAVLMYEVLRQQLVSR